MIKIIQLFRVLLTCLICTLFIQTSHAAVTQWVDIDTSQGWVEFPITIHGINTTAMIDTGANINAINYKLIHQHGWQFNSRGKRLIQGVHANQERVIYDQIPFQAFDQTLRVNEAAATLLGNTALILGTGFLQHFILQIDYPNQRMRFITPDSLDLKKSKNIHSKFNYERGELQIKVKVNGHKGVWMTLDTGNSGGLHMGRRLASTYNLLDNKETLVIGESQGFNQTGKEYKTTIDQLQFGPFELTHVPVSIPKQLSSEKIFQKDNKSLFERQRKTSYGLIGYDVLKHFVITMDFQKGYMHVSLPEEEK